MRPAVKAFIWLVWFGFGWLVSWSVDSIALVCHLCAERYGRGGVGGGGAVK